MSQITGTVTLDQIDLLEVNGDPSITPGIQAVDGSIAFLASTSVPRSKGWQKVGPLATDWIRIYGYIDTNVSQNDLTENDLQTILNRDYWPTELQVPAYNGDGSLNTLTIYKSATQINSNRLAKVTMAYTGGGDPLTETWQLFSLVDGVTVIKTVTFTYTVVSSDVTAIQKVTV